MILASWFPNSLLSRVHSSIDCWCLNSKLFTVVSFNFGSFSQTKIISQAQKNIISTDIAHFLWRRKQRRSSAAWRYHWLACVLSRVVRTSSPGSSPRQFSPTLPTPQTGLLIPWRNSSTASTEELYYSFYYNEGLGNKLTRAPLLVLAKSIYYYYHYFKHIFPS